MNKRLLKGDISLLVIVCVLLGISCICCRNHSPEMVKDPGKWNEYRIDTLEIHGTKHEYIIGYHILDHSPECWCNYECNE
jgi:hypothetical protein